MLRLPLGCGAVSECTDTMDYRSYVEKCIPTACIYSTVGHPNFAQVASLLLGLIGGIVSSLNIIVPFIVDRCACENLTQQPCPCEPPISHFDLDTSRQSHAVVQSKLKQSMRAPTDNPIHTLAHQPSVQAVAVLEKKVETLLSKVAGLEASLTVLQSEKDDMRAALIALGAPLALPAAPVSQLCGADSVALTAAVAHFRPLATHHDPATTAPAVVAKVTSARHIRIIRTLASSAPPLLASPRLTVKSPIDTLRQVSAFAADQPSSISSRNVSAFATDIDSQV
jgi:hypothetical protein